MNLRNQILEFLDQHICQESRVITPAATNLTLIRVTKDGCAALANPLQIVRYDNKTSLLTYTAGNGTLHSTYVCLDPEVVQTRIVQAHGRAYCVTAIWPLPRMPKRETSHR
jgi:hypothetical protein